MTSTLIDDQQHVMHLGFVVAVIYCGGGADTWFCV
jgi:hypothetical protein